MSMQDNKYVQAAQEDYEALKQKWDDVRARIAEKAGDKGSDDGQPDSRLAETAWNDFREQSDKLRAAGSTASTEVKGSYEAARDKVKKVMEAYQKAS